MKLFKRFLLLSIIIIFALSIQAQEPGNNLRKTVRELRLKFPDLKTWGRQGETLCYKSPEAEAFFYIKDGKVISEFSFIDGEDGFLKMWYSSLIKEFSKSARHFTWGTNKNSIILYYSYFEVHISYEPNEHVYISYSLYPYTN